MRAERRVIEAAGALLCLCALAAPSAATVCTMRFSLTGWSAFYKTASGTGTVTCDNGTSATVGLHAKGGGLTVGKSKISDGRGRFSDVGGIGDIYGSYGAAEAHAGMGKSTTAQVMTKGTVSLELTGKGEGIDLGVAFGKLTISKRR